MLPPDLLLYLCGVYLCLGPVYDSGCYGMSFIMAFHPGKNPHREALMAKTPLAHCIIYPGKLVRGVPTT